ncbi:MAG: enoyl-CoA hydratase/isomerase family protein [Chloroflexi bacterium]|nr:enoyl-CoA hydratase/isomerase family protein [Chloroflexota bacterium]
MEYENVILDKYGTDNRIGRITLNRPEKLNALSQALLTDLEAALKEAEADPDIRVIVVRGAGRTFCAGYDITPPSSPPPAAPPGTRPIDPIRRRMYQGANLQLMLWNLFKPTIAQVHGYAIAGGCEYAMMCDLVVAAEDAIFGHPGTRGLGTPRNACIWPMVLGMRKAKELMYTGNMIDGREAERIGMINKAVPADKLEEEVTALAERIAIQSADALAVHKHSVNHFYEVMGIYPAVHWAADFDAVYQYTEQAAAWQESVREKGLRGALAQRDGPYGDYGARPRT